MNRRLAVARPLLNKRAIFVLVLAFSVLGAGVLTRGVASAIAQRVLYEKSDILTAESQCSQDLANQYKSPINGRWLSPTYKGGFDGDYRTAINQSNPYAQLWWITEKGHPASAITPQNTNQPFQLDLQLNAMEFICSVVVNDNSNQAFSYKHTQVGTARGQGGFDNDRTPNPDGTNINAASLYTVYTREYSAQIVNPDTAHGEHLANIDYTTPLITDRTNSRYWLSNNVDTFRYYSPSQGFPGNHQVTIRFQLRYVKSFHNHYNHANTVTDCSSGGVTYHWENAGNNISVNGHNYTHLDPSDWTGGATAAQRTREHDSDTLWSNCGLHTVDVTFNIAGNPPNLTAPTVTASSCSVTGRAFDTDDTGQSLNVYLYDKTTGRKVATTTTNAASHVFTFNRPASMAANTDWQSHKYYVVAQGISSNDVPDGFDTTSAVFDVGPCADIRCDLLSGTLLTGVPANLTFAVKANNTSTGPPPIDGTAAQPQFHVSITGPSNFSTTVPYASYDSASKRVTSTQLAGFTPVGGDYTVKWGWAYPANNHHTRTDTTWVGGAPQCSTPLKAGYSPYFQVLGGDLSAGNGFTNAGACNENAGADINGNNTNQPGYLGASSGLGIFATGSVTNYISGAQSADPVSSPSVLGHDMSFGNYAAGYVQPNQYGGGFSLGSPSPTTLPCVHDYQADRPVNPQPLGGGRLSSGQLNVKLQTAGTYVAAPNGPGAAVVFGTGNGNDITIDGDVLTGNKIVTIYVDGDAYIDSNILYNYSSLQNIPQFRMIVKGNLYIDANDVDTLHGSFIVQKNGGVNTGQLFTCATLSGLRPNAVQDYANCSAKPLNVIGGMAVEGNMNLARSYGSIVAVNGVPAAAAETFQYSPEVWLNAGNSLGSPYQSYTNLPPVL